MPLVSKAFGDIITFTRASTGTYFDSAGVLQTATSGTPRFDYDPSTLAAQGLLIEEARTNSIRNNTMQGAVAGTPGTLPTNWAIGGVTTGLTISVVGTGTESGITYIDIRFNGTAGAALNPNILFDTSTGIAAANGQTWAWSSYVALAGGSLSNVTDMIAVQSMFSSTPTLLGTLSSSSFVPTNAGLRTQRQTFSTTLNQATTAFVRPQLQFLVANGAAIDITLRIGLPQLELGAFATSVIPTTTTALTRNADQASVNTLSPWYNTSGGTIYAEATGPIASIYRILAEGATASDFRDFSLAFDGLRGNFAARYVAGNFDVLGPTNSLTAGATVKLAGSYSATSADMAYNGVLAVSKNAITQRIPADRMFLGSRLGSSLQLNGHLRRVTYYPRTLSTAELQAITA